MMQQSKSFVASPDGIFSCGLQDAENLVIIVCDLARSHYELLS